MPDEAGLRRLRRVLRSLGGPPEPYVVFDLETSGLDTGDPYTLPTQVGWYAPGDGPGSGPGSLFVDWGLHPALDAERFYRRVDETRDAMARKGHSAVDSARLRAEGRPPAAAMGELAARLGATVAAGGRLVGFNCVAFDRPILLRSAALALGPGAVAELPVEAFLDLGLVAKAVVCGLEGVSPGTTVRSWYDFVAGARTRVRWNLQQSLEAYGVPRPAGPLHDAGNDCVATAGLLQAFARIAEDPTP